MKKLLVSLACLTLLLVGCSEEPKSKEEVKVTENGSYYPLKIVDATNEEIIIEEEPQTIVSLMPSNTEIVYSLGLGEKIIGISDYDNYPEEVTNKTKIGGLELNVEVIVSLNPDIVLAHESSLNSSQSSLEQIENAGIEVVVVDDAQSFESVYETILFIGEVMNQNEKANAVVNEMKQELASIQEKIKPYAKDVLVYAEVSPAPYLYTVGKNTFIGEAFGYLNVTNIFEEDGWLAIDNESVVLKNPEMIFTMYGYYVDNAIEEMKTRDGWNDISAIKNGQVFDVNSDLVTRSGPRLIKGVEELAKAIYPEAFTDK